jgi:hypothetical protein
VGADHDVPFHDIALPDASTAMQSVDEAQETPVGFPDGPRDHDHVDPFHLKAGPDCSTVIQNEEDAHDADANWVPPVATGVDHEDPLQVSACP